ncbi:CfrBI family restriction endonuclease [Enterococcus cecorum]|uniref:CfrBI family restriction endonuclease n=1 Tax=Enterococcus cecorum TaxID=44008 RepID=UPI0032C49434
MITFENKVIEKTVDRLILGEDYREEVVNSINAVFFDFTMDFFKKIVTAKINDEGITIDWYKKYFISGENFDAVESAIYAGLNKKTITNIYGSATKTIVLSAANNNFEYLSNFIGELEKDSTDGLAISIKISYKDVTVDLSLTESLLVINALATKKLQLRGGAWSSIGKKVEKPLLDRLCKEAGVPKENIDNSQFKKDKSKKFDREVDYKLISSEGKIYRIEVKLMGKGNPESADATIARDSDIFVADTLSEQNCNQLYDRGVEYIILKDNPDSIQDFKKVLDRLNIPYKK